MRIVFFAYWLSYSAIIFISEFLTLPLWVSKLITTFMFYNLGFVLVAPLFLIVYPSTIKSHRTDPVFLNLCLMAGIIRILVWSAVVWGLRNNTVIWGINIFVMGIVALGEKHFKRIENDYFKY